MSALATDGSPDGLYDTEGLWDEITRTYDAAQETGAATRTETSTVMCRDEEHGVDFVLRLALALKKKPKGPAKGGAKKEWRNPFLPYEEDLWVQHLSDTHTLLLNKFNVVEHHTLVVTREFEQQAEGLTTGDLAATAAVMKSYPRGALAFFNCGEMSGFSQPHRHTQIVPLPLADGEGARSAPPFEAVIDAAINGVGAKTGEMVELRALPFRAYAARLTGSHTGEELAAVYGALVDAAADGVPRSEASYNVVMTNSFMMAVPRSGESCGPVSVNAMGYAGTLLVKSDEEREFVEDNGPMSIIAQLGVPW